MVWRAAIAQVNVLTAHNDIARTGQNLNETILTPANVNTAQFGELFSHHVAGTIQAQPLYVANVTIPGKGVHNVVYVVTSADTVYAFDADSNGGVNSSPLWQWNLTTNTNPNSTALSKYGVTGTPVIDLSSNTIYLVSSENQGAVVTFRLHALDITTGAEKFGGPVAVQGSVPGTGSGSVGGVLAFDPTFEYQRPGLLLLNGVVYAAFGANADNGSWHGWIFSFNAATLQQISIFCTSPNGTGGGIWMSGAGLAAEVNDPNKPYGRMFVTTGNGTYTANAPYTSSMSYGMSLLDLDLTGGTITVQDDFTPYNETNLQAQDADLASGGPVLLPAQTLPNGSTLLPLVEAAKSGMIYILNRNNLGGYHTTGDQIVQEVQTPRPSSSSWGSGIWGTEAYWNNRIYYGGILPQGVNTFDVYSFVNGTLSTNPTGASSEQYAYPGPTPSVSSNGTANGITWLVGHGGQTIGPGVLLAYNATNLSALLYSSNANLSRDNPGQFVAFSVPTIANGKVYVGATSQVSTYGLLGSVPTVAPPTISPTGGTFTGSQTVTMADSTPGALIYYTIDGSLPTYNSKLYRGPFSVTASETVTAIATATGYLLGAPVTAVFSSTANAANPVFSLAAGTYSGKQTLKITDATPGAAIYYTVDGSTPTTASLRYTGAFSVGVSETVQAFATAPSLQSSSIVSAAYDIVPAYTIDFSQGFANAQASGKMQFNGSTDLDDFRLQLTNGGVNEAGSAFITTAVPIWAFTTDFTFQLSNPVGDGITFTIQGNSPTALGSPVQGLGYSGIKNSIAIKFSIHGDLGQGNNSTGLYINGAAPTVPSIDLTNTGLNLRSGNFITAHITYDDKNLNITLTDQVTLATWSHSFIINIPEHIGSSTGYVGFTGGTGGSTASQKIIYWTYLAGIPALPNYPAGFDPVNGQNILALNGNAAISGTSVQLTNGSLNQTSSAYYVTPVDVTAFTTDFDFVINSGSNSTLGEGMTFVIQNAGPKALGSGGGGLGYATVPNSVAIKFDFYSDAGEGSDSTGVFTNGAMPTLPDKNFAGTGLNLTGGHQYHVHMTYDGTTLSWVTHDLTHGNNISEQLAINIPETIGSNTAYIGFTGATGASATANESVLDWTFTNP